jgi:uncharacterized membrane protein
MATTSDVQDVPDRESAALTPRWLWLSTLVLSVIGLADSVYLTIDHFTNNATLVCQANSVVNCAKVTTSAESTVFGIPVAVLGLVFFVAMVALTIPRSWRPEYQLLRWARLGAVAVGVLFVAYLVSSELILIHSICEYCTVVHVVTLALFVLIIVGEFRAARRTR